MSTRKTDSDPIVTEVEDLKRLMILMLVKMGTPQGEIALALGVDQSSVSRIVPTRKAKKFENMK